MISKPLNILNTSIRWPRILRFHRLNKFSSSSLSSYGKRIIFVILRCTLSDLSISFLQYGDQNCTQYSRWGRTSDLYSFNITFSDLFSKARAMKPTSLLAFLKTPEQFWLGFKSLDIVIPRSFSLFTAESCWAFIKYWARFLLLPICSTLHFSTLNFICHPLAQLANRFRSDSNVSLSYVLVTLLAISCHRLGTVSISQPTWDKSFG